MFLYVTLYPPVTPPICCINEMVQILDTVTSRFWEQVLLLSFSSTSCSPSHTQQPVSATWRHVDLRSAYYCTRAGSFFNIRDSNMVCSIDPKAQNRGDPYVQLQPAELTSIPSMPSVCQAWCDLSTSARTVLCSRAMSWSISGDSPICEE